MDGIGALYPRIRNVLPDLLDAPVFAVDETLRFAFANAAFLAHIDPDNPTDVQGAFLRDRFDDATVIFVREAVAQARKSETPVDVEVPEEGSAAGRVSPFKPGTRYRVLFIPDPEGRGSANILFVGRTRDKKPSSGLSQTEKLRYFSFFEKLEDFIFFMTDGSGVMTNVAGQVEAITGFDSDHFIGMFADRLVHKDDAGRMIQILEKSREGKKGAAENLRLLHKSGSLLNFSIYYAPWHEREGVFGGVIGIARVHPLVKTAAETPDHAHHLEVIRGVAEGVAGDFNNIFVGLTGNLNLLKAQVDRQSPLWPPVERIDAAAQRAAELTRQLMLSARGMRGAPRPTDLAELLRQTVDHFLKTADEGLDVRVSVKDGLAPVNADPTHLRLMISNCIQNAWEAMPGGGVIEVRLEAAALAKGEIVGLRVGEYAVLTVRDEGIGIDERELPRIFDPFFTTKSMSRGLGLSAAQGVVNEMRGKVLVESREGQGATFTVYLPVIPREEKRGTTSRRSGIAGSRIMVVDDEALVRDFCKAALKSVGAEAVVLADGREALASLAREPHGFDLIILDLVLPDIKGEDVFKEMLKINPRQRIAFCSGHTGLRDQLEHQGLLKRAVTFLDKPFDLPKLLALVYQIKNPAGGPSS